MSDQIHELIDTLQRLERLLVRFEIDTATRLHVVDYQSTIQLLWENFQQQMSALTHGSCEQSDEHDLPHRPWRRGSRA